RETAEWCANAERNYPFLATYLPERAVKSLFDVYRETARKQGYEASPYQLGHLIPIYVGETDEQAKREAAQHVMWLYHRGLRYVWEILFPPGYQSTSSMVRMTNSFQDVDWSSLSFDQMNELGYCVVGSAETVRRRLSHSAKTLGFGIIMGILQIGDMPKDRTRRNMELFASKVMPALRDEFGDMDVKRAGAA
ncbi:MAG: LLM class flavin-dependent oxidoreductase, partial [Candidatus Binataceae bacterium]